MNSSQHPRAARRPPSARTIAAPAAEAKIRSDGAVVPYELGERLAALRRERGLSLTALALKAGVTKGFLSLVERGRKAPSISTLLRLSQAYAIPVGGLLDEIGRASCRERV